LSSSFFSTQRRAANAGLFIAPVVPAIWVAVLDPPVAISDVPWLVGLMASFYLAALALGSLVGLPVFYLLARFRFLNLLSALGGGFVVGVVAITVLSLLHIQTWRWAVPRWALHCRLFGLAGNLA
jgi:hypothetical protein